MRHDATQAAQDENGDVCALRPAATGQVYRVASRNRGVAVLGLCGLRRGEGAKMLTATQRGYEVTMTAYCGCCTVVIDADIDSLMAAIDAAEARGDSMTIRVGGVAYGGLAPRRSFHVHTLPRLGQDAGLPVPAVVEEWIRVWRMKGKKR